MAYGGNDNSSSRPNNVIAPGKPIELPGFMKSHPAFVGKLTSKHQQAMTAEGDMQDNGSANYAEAAPSLTPDGRKQGIPGANARSDKRKQPRSRTNDAGGKGAGDIPGDANTF